MRRLPALVVWGLLVLCGPLGLAAENGSLTVFADGKPSVYLDLPWGEHALPVECGPAIDDLKRCFHTMTGVALPEKAQPGLVPIRLKLLPADDAGSRPLGSQGCEVGVQPDGITLAAPTALGIVNAVFCILDSWGCRWVVPGELGEVIPTQSRLTLPLGTRRFLPGSDNRVLTAGLLSDHYRDGLAAWVQRNRMGTQRWITGQHYYSYAIPPQRYFKEHPEYYALIGGTRSPSQLCTTNPEVIDLTVAAAREWFKRHSSVDSFPMDPNDNTEFCQCDRCTALDPPDLTPDGLPRMTDRVIQFANEVARRIRTEYPDKVVALYAYSNHSLPPVNVKPEPNVIVFVCRSDYCWLHLTPNPQCPSPGEFYELTRAWRPLVRTLYSYEYYPISWIGGLPCPNYLEFARTVRDTRQLGVEGSWEDASLQFAPATFINDYLAIRLKCQPELDVDKELADLCRSYFGPAGPAMEKYYRTMARVVEYTHPGRGRVSAGLAKYDEMFSPEIVAGASAAIREALQSASPETTYRRRVDVVDVGHRYLEAYLDGIANAKQEKCPEAVAAFARAEELIDQMDSEPFGAKGRADAHRRIHGAGLTFLAEYCPKQMGMITHWKLLGPFENNARSAHLTTDPFEPLAEIGGPVKRKDGSEARWRDHVSPAGFLDFQKAFAADASQWRYFYAYAGVVVNSPHERDAQLRMDSFWPFRVYLNGKEVFFREGADADHPDKRIVNVQLSAGKNTIVFKCGQLGDSGVRVRPWRLYLRITDRQGTPLDDVTVVD